LLVFWQSIPALPAMPAGFASEWASATISVCRFFVWFGTTA